jgi:hypothetical protein
MTMPSLSKYSSSGILTLQKAREPPSTGNYVRVGLLVFFIPAEKDRATLSTPVLVLTSRLLRRH